MSKGRKPAWLRVHASCPDCGFVLDIGDKNYDNPFDCTRCQAHYTSEDFWAMHQDKLAHHRIENEERQRKKFA